jgi:hypothetical protein
VKPLVNIADVETFTSGHGEVFAASHGLLSRPLGGAKIGYREDEDGARTRAVLAGPRK